MNKPAITESLTDYVVTGYNPKSKTFIEEVYYTEWQANIALQEMKNLGMISFINPEPNCVFFKE